ncbi:MAG: hypothetical protein KGZ94_05970 [Clostridia bacterium]|nr:hypothetical protein [Clostridia bacterium]
MNNNQIAVIEKFDIPAIAGGNMAAIAAEEMEGLQDVFSCDRVKIPSGGGLAFEVPGEDPYNPDTVKELVGIVVDHHPVNAFWTEKFTGQNNPPDCSALDGKTGEGNPGGGCKGCKFNQWGSDEEGKGKACKNMHRVFILPEGEMFPLMLTLPPTSIKNWANFLAKRVVSKGKRVCEVITKITLKKAANSTGIQYSQAQFAVVGILSSNQAIEAKNYSDGIKAMTRKLEIMSDDYSTTTVDLDVEEVM